MQHEGFSYETHVRQDHSKWYIQADIDAKRHFLANMVLEIDTYVCDKGASEKLPLVRGRCEVIDPAVSRSGDVGIVCVAKRWQGKKGC